MDYSSEHILCSDRTCIGIINERAGFGDGEGGG